MLRAAKTRHLSWQASGTGVSLNSAAKRNKAEARPDLRSGSARQAREIVLTPRSTRRSAQFLAMLYIHALMLVVLAVFSRNLFSSTIRTVLLALIR